MNNFRPFDRILPTATEHWPPEWKIRLSAIIHCIEFCGCGWWIVEIHIIDIAITVAIF